MVSSRQESAEDRGLQGTGVRSGQGYSVDRGLLRFPLPNMPFTTQKLIMLTCNISMYKIFTGPVLSTTLEAEARGSQVQVLFRLQSKLKAILGNFVRPCL